jgi:hypothetical protein
MPQKAQVAQLVEQRTENPRVGGSIPPLGTIIFISKSMPPILKNLLEKEPIGVVGSPVGSSRVKFDSPGAQLRNP